MGKWKQRRQNHRDVSGLDQKNPVFKGKLTSIRSMRMGSASCSVMTSGYCTVAKVLSGSAGESHQPYYSSQVVGTEIRTLKTEGQAQASYQQIISSSSFFIYLSVRVFVFPIANISHEKDCIKSGD